uniref:Uncharacterized protein n=1 Tax=Plectus sambesii TaxID=2011161 RepID=A0A914W843_9BILA
MPSSGADFSSEFGRKVWAPDPLNGFFLGRIVDIGADSILVAAVNDSRSQPISASYDAVFPAEDDERKDVDDNCKDLESFHLQYALHSWFSHSH